MKTHHITKSIVAAFALTLVTNLHAQTPAVPAPPAAPAAPAARDPFAAGKAAAPAPAPVTAVQAESAEAVNISLAYEAFSLPLAKAGELQRKGISDAELYHELVASGKLERLLVLRTKSGQRAVLGNVTDYRFPTEFTQPQLAGDFAEGKPGDARKAEPKVPLPIAPTAFEESELGDSFEIEPTLWDEAKIVDIQFSMNHTALAGRDPWGQGLALVEQPRVETQKLNTSLCLTVGSPRFVGTLNPVFGNGVTPRAEQNVWFCFITATLTSASPRR